MHRVAWRLRPGSSVKFKRRAGMDPAGLPWTADPGARHSRA